jgi:hypothetical protein
VAYVRTVRTASGATAVQIVWSYHRGSRKIEHFGSAHDEAELELLKAAARQRLAAGQGELDLGLDVTAPGGPLPITSSRMGCLLDALSRGFEVLGLGRASGGDVVFRDLVLARIIEPASKLDSLRVLEEAGAAAASYRTVLRRLPAYAKDAFRQQLSAACAAHAGLAGPRPAWAAHARDSRCRHDSFAYAGSRRLMVGYDAGTAPASSSTRALSSLLDGSMIRASTSCRNTSSPPAAS